MNIHVEVVGPCRKQVSIEVPAEQVQTTISEIVSGYQRYARIPGFRVGKAPVDLVKRHFRKDILKEAKERLIPGGYQAALQQEKLKVANVIDVTESDPVEGKPFGFQITVDVVPDFELPAYKGIRVEAQPADVTEQAIDEVVDRMRDRMASFVAEEGRVAGKSDRVMVNYTATVDGQPLDLGNSNLGVLAKAENFGVILDPEYSFIPEFVDGLTGAKAGEHRTVVANFDEKFVEKSLAGKQATYAVEVLAVERKQLPELTEEFLKTMGAESVAAMRQRIKDDLARMKSSQEERRVQDEICKKLLEETVMNLPESIVQRRTAEEVYDVVEYNSERGVDREVIEQNREQIFANAAKTAEEKLKIRYILLKIAEAEKMTVTEAEIDGFIRTMALRERKDPAKVKENIVKNNRLADVRDDLLASKSLKMLADLQKPQAAAV
ncbi:MAG TPA: trigger factor [Kiritimatiellia bacterium]|nr:trigger factor [Kiritimatiellia bacterium]HMP34676.1 trigger factor [Kiritimatiellia bacterium]